MRTNFSARQLADSDTAEANKILRACVHCGFCNATCPTYLLLGDELDGPRGRIYLIKDMLENDRPATKQIATHIDRCLSCLACMTTCPSGVHYMHLVDQGRAHVEATYRRPLHERLLRDFLAFVLPRPAQFRRAMQAARLARPFAALLPGRLGSMLRLAPRAAPDASRIERPQLFPAEGAACCGALTHHLGNDATAYVKANVDSWLREVERGGLDAVVVNASGCGTMVKDYGYLLRSDPAYAAKAAKVSALARDVSEFMAELGLRQPAQPTGQRVAYHAACSLQHGQRVIEQPKQLLGQAGFQVVEVPEGHICCGSAGTYNMLEPEIATQLRDRKVRHIASVAPDIVAAGNIGCITQIAAGMAIPVVHTVELLDWATGGPKPAALA